MRDRTKVNWEFVCQGTFNPELMKDELDLHYAETARGEHGFQYCYINITKKRAGQLENAFMEYDRMVPDSMQIKLTNLPTEPAMIGFGRGNAYKKHVIYKEIKEQQRKACSSYKEWRANAAESQDDEMAMEDSGDELEAYTLPKKRQANLVSNSQAYGKQCQGEPASNQQTLDSFLKRTDKKLVKIDNDNCETTKYTLGRLSTIDNSIADSHTKLDGLKKTAVDFDVKLDDIKTTQLKVADGIFNGFQTLDESLDETHDKLDTIADKQKGFSKLTTSRDHYQQMAFKLRGQLGAKAV